MNAMDSIERARLERLERLTTPRLTKYIPHRPTPPQAAFLLLDCNEAMYGGAAGGGKSDALLMAALQYVDVPGYSAILFRRSYPDLALPEAIMSRSKVWLRQTDAQWNEQQKRWTFPSGATVSFGYLDIEDDKYRYASAEFQFIGFDELTQFTETKYTFLFSRLRRRADVLVPLRMRSASNPGGVGHEWVKKRFIEEARQNGRIFIPAKLADNPHLDRDSYTEMLMQMDPVTRAQLLKGDWAITAGGNVFRRGWFKDFEELPNTNEVVLSWDTAFKEGEENDYSVCTVWGKTRNGFYLLDLWRQKVGYPELRRQAIALDAKWNPDAVLIEDKASGQSLIQELRGDTAMPLLPVKVDRDKITRAQAVTALIEAGRVFIPKGAPWVADFLDEVSAFPEAPHDDQVDSMTQALNYMRAMPGIIEYMRNQAEQAAEPPMRNGTPSPVPAEPYEEDGGELMEVYRRALEEAEGK